MFFLVGSLNRDVTETFTNIKVDDSEPPQRGDTPVVLLAVTPALKNHRHRNVRSALGTGSCRRLDDPPHCSPGTLQLFQACVCVFIHVCPIVVLSVQVGQPSPLWLHFLGILMRLIQLLFLCHHIFEPFPMQLLGL